jgi:hypothetical protein
VPKLEVGVMLGGDKGEPIAGCDGEGRVEQGWICRGWVDMTLAGEAIVEFDDLGRG